MIKYGSNNIGKIFFGSNQIGKAYFGSQLVYQSGGGPTPPPTPTLTAYIRGGADGSYIDTGITASNTVKVIVWARNWNPALSAYNWLCGAADSANVNAFILGLASNVASGQLAVCYGTVYTHLSDKWTLMSHYHKYELSANGFYVDDTLITTVTASTFSGSRNIHLFGYNLGGTHTDSSVPKDICACKIYKGGALVRDFVAVDSPSVGFYDKVSGTLFANAGSGSLSYGEFETDAYTPLEYISTSGGAYFDSGIKGSNTLDFLCKFKTEIVTQSSYAWAFGCQTTSNSKRYGITFGSSASPASICAMCYNSQTMAYSAFSNGTYVAGKNGAKHSLYMNNALKFEQNASASTFTTDYNIYVGMENDAGAAFGPYYGRIYYLRFGSQRNFVPAKVNNAVGMYDTYNEVFHPSDSSTDFIAGPTL